MIEEDVAAPSTLVVAGVAAAPLSPVMNVVVAMTGVTGRIEALLVELAPVTVRAADLFMSPAQREMGAPVVFERGTSPLNGGVARLAGAPELSAVRVIALVAAMACRRSLLRGENALVAARAGGVGMPTQQREVGLAGMVERGRGPRTRRVTSLAGAAEAAAVPVVPLVAPVTACRRGLVTFGCVATFTARAAMAAFEPKRGRVVIETDSLPTVLRMAFFTGIAEAALVRVLASVASAASCRGFAVPFAGRVTFVTADARVAAPERHVREAMLESLSIEPHELRRAASVFGMAALA